MRITVDGKEHDLNIEKDAVKDVRKNQMRW